MQALWEGRTVCVLAHFRRARRCSRERELRSRTPLLRPPEWPPELPPEFPPELDGLLRTVDSSNEVLACAAGADMLSGMYSKKGGGGGSDHGPVLFESPIVRCNWNGMQLTMSRLCGNVLLKEVVDLAKFNWQTQACGVLAILP